MVWSWQAFLSEGFERNLSNGLSASRHGCSMEAEASHGSPVTTGCAGVPAVSGPRVTPDLLGCELPSDALGSAAPWPVRGRTRPAPTPVSPCGQQGPGQARGHRLLCHLLLSALESTSTVGCFSLSK